MKSIRVRLAERSYDICFGPLQHGFINKLNSTLPKVSNILIVTSQAVSKAGHLGRLESVLRKQVKNVSAVILPNGENHKNLKTVADLYKKGFAAKLDRKSLVIGLGGGVVTDMTGFFAATYMRGIPFVSIPTTLLGMVDAAIGGKTGVDVAEGKNLVGAFWQPKFVWIDQTVLSTLPKRQWRTGFAEVIKYGVIKEPVFFQWLEKRIQKDPNFWKWSDADIFKVLYISARCKAIVVSGDERETPLKGGREILNFGHTTGHALEAATGYEALSHGEAISIGMVIAGLLARREHLWSDQEQMRLVNLLQKAGLPTTFPQLSNKERARFWSALLKDKKNVGGQLRFVLPKKIGKVDVRTVALSKRSFQ